ncbi:flavin-containing monooxygenase FMO GS-OX-like 4 [Corylus avellana]|uniref:flavin-containing monooxygenase FMO GS-OX-like 4 n=1 Tax=Corylus avellana TaxID=13451 RepID=UPI00286D0A91|nr:flavin-containing monooxygenase FMO GS-OX-like 4 [Corylus avellana]
MYEQSLKVAVIGAGMAGLLTARELKREGHRVIVFEKSISLGGTWVYDPRVETNALGLDPARQIVHSSMYRSLRVNLPRRLMGFLDYPFSLKEGGDPREFPGHEEVLRYLEDFARDFRLVELIRFGHEVVRVEQVNEVSHEWVVESRTRGSESEMEGEVFEAVAVCNGHHTEPRIAEFPGMDIWPGMQVHSHNYRTPEPFQNQIVVLIGNGPSAHDILREISSVAKEVHQALRASDVHFKKLENRNNIWQHSVIKCANEDGKVVFQDGSFVYADAIIHCTGFKYHFPFLRTNGIVSVDDNCVGPLYKHVFPPCLAPWLSFVGLPYRAAPTLIIELQSRWVAKVLAGKLALPSEEEMASSVEELYQHMKESGLPKHHTHQLQQNKFDYENWLVTQLRLPPLEEWREEMYFHALKKITSHDDDEYRDTWDVIGGCKDTTAC